MDEITKAEKELTALLNYGGFRVIGDPANRTFLMDWRAAIKEDEVSHMRHLAAAFTNLADVIESGR